MPTEAELTRLGAFDGSTSLWRIKLPGPIQVGEGPVGALYLDGDTLWVPMPHHGLARVQLPSQALTVWPRPAMLRLTRQGDDFWAITVEGDLLRGAPGRWTRCRPKTPLATIGTRGQSTVFLQGERWVSFE